MPPKGKPKTVVRYRSAETGQYVTKRYALNNPKTTVRETDKVMRRKKKRSN